MCYIRGEQVPLPNNKHKFVFSASDSFQNLLRTKRHTRYLADIAKQTKAKLYIGVKGFSVLSCLREFDYVTDFVTDSMHSLWINLIPFMMDLWFSEKYKVSHTHICSFVQLTDENLFLG